MRSSRSAEALPGILDAIVEGSGLAVAYLLLQVLWGRSDAHLGIVELSLLAGMGLVLARRPAFGLERGALVVPFALAAGVGGWLVADAARGTLLSGDPVRAATFHAAGWLAGVAVLRGAAHADPANDDLVVSRALTLGLPLLALAWCFAQLPPAEVRVPFTEPAFVATLAFVTTALMAVAVTRLRALGIASGFEWRTNRPWLAVLGGVILATMLAALPLAAALGLPLGSAVRGALGPIGVIVAACVAAFGLAGSMAGEVLAGLIQLVPVSIPDVPPTPAPALPTPGQEGPPSNVSYVLAALLMIAVAAFWLGLALWLVHRIWQVPGRTLVEPGAVEEERQIVVPAGAIRIGLPRVGRRVRPRATPPRDAVGAYLALLEGIHDAPSVARAETETPAAHAERLRRAGVGDLRLDLLAADYELVRYGDRRLQPAEHRRALARWRALVARLGR